MSDEPTIVDAITDAFRGAPFGFNAPRTAVTPTPPEPPRFRWNEPNACECGAALLPMKDWDDAGRDWSNTVCSACGRFYVDEEDYIAVYDSKETDR